MNTEALIIAISEGACCISILIRVFVATRHFSTGKPGAFVLPAIPRPDPAFRQLTDHFCLHESLHLFEQAVIGSGFGFVGQEEVLAVFQLTL